MSDDNSSDESTCGVAIDISVINLVLAVTGQAFDTTKPLNYAASNIISAIVYGNRFDYSDPQFKAMVDRANEVTCLTGSPSIQVLFADLIFKWLY